jgi:hypothetical protein
MRTRIGLPVMLGLSLAVLSSPWSAEAGHGWAFGPAAWTGPSWGPAPVAIFPAALPYGSRFYHPPGLPLSYYEEGTGTTYCLSKPTGFYYPCGYSRPTRDAVEPAFRLAPGAVPSVGDLGLPLPSGVLVFRLPHDAEAEVDGYPVGLSRGLGIMSVRPGQHRVIVRASGAEYTHAVTVQSQAILTVTPAAVIPSAP